MSLAEFGADARIIWRMACGQPRRGDHATRQQEFYAPQAARYDTFRERLLHGRAKLIDRLGLVDFHIPASGAALANGFWRRWFAHDRAHLSAAHPPTLFSHLSEAWADRRRAPLLSLPAPRAPYYLYVDRRTEAAKSVSVAR